MDLSATGRVILITGATSGIGRAAAHRFAQQGAALSLTGRNRQRLDAVCEEARAPGTMVEGIAGDLCDDAFLEELVEDTIRRFGQLDVLVNAAGIIHMGSLESTATEDYDRVMNINLRSIFLLTRRCIPHLEATRGNIVNVSSIAGSRSFPGIISYCVSKAALDQMTRCTALELAAQGIRVNGVNPGVVVTGLHTSGGMTAEAYDRFLEHSQTTHPLGRVGTPEEVADLILFLASESASWITGQNLNIDGGRSNTCAR